MYSLPQCLMGRQVLIKKGHCQGKRKHSKEGKCSNLSEETLPHATQSEAFLKPNSKDWVLGRNMIFINCS